MFINVATQYCDGLRGPLIIYDPNDPHADLYDVDDGTFYQTSVGDCIPTLLQMVQVS